jgi:gamma-glutamyltranspeptidase
MAGNPIDFEIYETTPQVIMNVIDHRLNVQAAVNAAAFITNGCLTRSELRRD